MALFSRIKTWVSNEVLTAADLNAEFDNILTNSRATSITGYSADTTTMQTTADPYPGSSESLASSVAEELTRLRYVIKQMSGQTQWYIDPVGSLSTGGIDAANLASNAVTTVKINNLAVTTAKIDDLGVTTGKIAANAVTRAKLASLANLSSTGTGAALAVTGTTITTLCTRTFTGTGRPIALIFQGDSDAAQTPYLRVNNAAGAEARGYLLFYRDSTILAKYVLGAKSTGGTAGDLYLPPSAFTYVDTAATSSPVTYYIKAAGLTSDDVVTANYSVLLAYEL